MATEFETELELELVGEEVELEVRFTWSPGYPEQGPSYSSGGEPATGDEIELVEVKRGGVVIASDADLDERIYGWLADHWEPPEPDYPEPDYDPREDDYPDRFED